MPRSKFFKAEMMMPQAMEADTFMSGVTMNEPKSANIVQDDEKIVSIRQFFPETWIWNIEKTE